VLEDEDEVGDKEEDCEEAEDFGEEILATN
jgi:hypothetical protein